MQLLHDKLPVGYELNKQMSTYDSTCQACQKDTETVQHMFQCTNLDYLAWRQAFFRKLVSLGQKIGMDLGLLDIMVNGMECGFT